MRRGIFTSGSYYNMMQRSLLLFENVIKSKETLKRYKYYLDIFLKFYHLKDCDSLGSMNNEKLQIMIEDYVMDLKKRVNPNSVPTYITPLQTFLEINDSDLKWKKIHRLCPAKIKSGGRTAYNTEDIKKMLELEPQRRNRALIHILASTGMRKGALSHLKISNLKQMPRDCYAVLVYEDSIEEYWTFLTPEASKELDLYFEERKNDGESLNENSPIFRSKYQFGLQKIVPMTDKSIDQTMERIVKRAGVRKRKTHNRYDKMLEHAFRKRFETIVKLNKEIPVAVAEKLIGHKAYYDDRGNHIQLDENYVVPEVERLFKFYEHAIPELTISSEERMKAENIQLRKETKSQEEIRKQIKDELKKELLEELEFFKQKR